MIEIDILGVERRIQLSKEQHLKKYPYVNEAPLTDLIREPFCKIVKMERRWRKPPIAIIEYEDGTCERVSMRWIRLRTEDDE